MDDVLKLFHHKGTGESQMQSPETLLVASDQLFERIAILADSLKLLTSEVDPREAVAITDSLASQIGYLADTGTALANNGKYRIKGGAEAWFQ
jgi:hypothetical protein